MILIILFVLTAVTVLSARMVDLGALNLPVAMVIAGVKAALVVLFFMHMLEAEVINKIVFVISLLFLALLILGSYGDLATRWKPSIPSAGERSAEIVVSAWHEDHGGGHDEGAAEGAGHGAAAHEPAPAHP